MKKNYLFGLILGFLLIGLSGVTSAATCASGACTADCNGVISNESINFATGTYGVLTQYCTSVGTGGCYKAGGGTWSYEIINSTECDKYPSPSGTGDCALAYNGANEQTTICPSYTRHGGVVELADCFHVNCGGSNNDMFNFADPFFAGSCTQSLQNTTASEWANQGCVGTQENQTRSWVQYDANNCGSYSNTTFYEEQAVNNWTNTSFSGWSDVGCSEAQMNQTRSKVQYDTYACGTNTTFSEYQSVVNLLNTTMTDWANLTCSESQMNQTQYKIQYDTYACATNVTFNFYQLVNNFLNTSLTDWTNVGCSEAQMNQSRYKIEYDDYACGANTTFNYYQSINDWVNSSWSDWTNLACLVTDKYWQQSNLTESDNYGCGASIIYSKYRNDTATCTFATETNFNGATTDLYNVSNLSAVENFTLEDTSFGNVKFIDNLDLSLGGDFDSYVVFRSQYVKIESDNLPALANHSAIIQFYGVEQTNPTIYMDYEVCPADVCQRISYEGGVLTFNVTHFTIYSLTSNALCSSSGLLSIVTGTMPFLFLILGIGFLLFVIGGFVLKVRGEDMPEEMESKFNFSNITMAVGGVVIVGAVVIGILAMYVNAVC